MNRQPTEKNPVQENGSNLSRTLAQLIPFVSPKREALLSAIRAFWRIPEELQLSYIPADRHPEGFPQEAILLRLESSTSGQRWELSLMLNTSPKPAISLPVSYTHLTLPTICSV